MSLSAQRYNFHTVKLITPRVKSLPNQPALNARAWYVLVSNKSTSVVKRELDTLSLMYAFEGKSAIEYFLPTCFMRAKRACTAQATARKLALTHVFIHSTERGVAAIKKALPRLNLNTPINAKTGKRKYLSLHDSEMRMIRKVADAFAGQLPCHSSDTYDLNSCDWVRVVEGPFAGVEGAMVSTKGKRGGQVLLPMLDHLCASTGDLTPTSYIVLEFGKGNRHPYHVFDNYLPRVTDALAERLTTGTLADSARATVRAFVKQYGELSPRTLNIESTHAGLMLMSHAALGDIEAAAAMRRQCEELLPRLTAEYQTALHLAMIYAATGDATCAARLRTLIARWHPIPATNRKQQTVASLLTRFEPLHTGKETSSRTATTVSHTAFAARPQAG